MCAGKRRMRERYVMISLFDGKWFCLRFKCDCFSIPNHLDHIVRRQNEAAGTHTIHGIMQCRIVATCRYSTIITTIIDLLLALRIVTCHTLVMCIFTEY